MNVEAMMEKFAEAWNRHDADALAAMWTADGELNHPWGFHAVGRDAVRRLLTEEHNGSMQSSVLRILGVTTPAGSRSVEVDGLLDHVQAPNGRAYDLRHKLSVMFVEEAGETKIRTMTATANPR